MYHQMIVCHAQLDIIVRLHRPHSHCYAVPVLTVQRVHRQLIQTSVQLVHIILLLVYRVSINVFHVLPVAGVRLVVQVQPHA